MTTKKPRPVRTLAAAAAAALTLLVAGCSGAGSSDSAAPASSDGKAAPVAPEVARYAADGSVDALASGGGTAAADDESGTAMERAVIATGDLRVTSKNPGDARRDALAVVRQLRGLVADEQGSSDDDGKLEQVDLTLRVPSASFEDALDRLGEVGTVRHRSQSAEDVTTQVIDTRARVRAQAASVASIRKLLARAKTIGEVMSIEGELSQRQAALDSLTQQQKFLADQTSLATVTLSIERTAKDEPTDDEAGGFVGGLHDGWDALGDTARALGTGIGAVLPFAAVLAALGVPVWLARRRRAVSAR